MFKKLLLVGFTVALVGASLSFTVEAQELRLLNQTMASLIGTTIGGLGGSLLGFWSGFGYCWLTVGRTGHCIELFAAYGATLGFLIGAPLGSASLVIITSTEGDLAFAFIGAYAAEFLLIWAVTLYLQKALEEADRSPIPEKTSMVVNSTLIVVPPLSCVAIAIGTLVGYNWETLTKPKKKLILPNWQLALVSIKF